MPRRLEQVVRRLLETGQLQHAVSHLAQAEPRDAQHLALVGHDVREQLHVPRINVHVAHHEADLIDDGFPRGFDAEDVAHFQDGVRPRGKAVDPLSRHATAETIAFDQQGILAVVVSLDDGAGSLGVSTNGDVGKDALDRLRTEEELGVFFRGSFDGSVLGAALVLVESLDFNADVVLVTSDIVRV